MSTTQISPSKSSGLAVFLLIACLGGCSTLSVPDLMTPGGESGLVNGKRYQPLGDAALASTSLSETAYHKVRQAKTDNAVVLQVVGDEVPLRVLPLPPSGGSAGGSSAAGGPAVFVSTLLTQTGVMAKMGNVEATLYRASPQAINGIRMDVLFDDDEIRPETDYALQAGDRVVVQKAQGFGMDKLVDIVLAR